MTPRRTRLEILADNYKDFTYYFTDFLCKKPFIVIGKCEIQFKNRKDAADFAEAVHHIKNCKYLNMSTKWSVRRARKALEGRV